MLTAQTLAAEFCAVLRATLSEPQMFAIVGGLSEPDDFCDSNMVMDAAFENLTGRGSFLPSDVEGGDCTEAQQDADLAIWNAAVGIVNRAGFAL